MSEAKEDDVVINPGDNKTSDTQKIINVLQGLTQSVNKLNSDVRKWHKSGKF